MYSTESVRLFHNPKQKRESRELQKQRKLIERYLDDGEYEKGLKASFDAIKRFPQKPTLTHSWALDFLLSLGQKKEAIEVLGHGLRHGAWWSPKLLRTGWGELEGQSEYPRILGACRRRFSEAAASARAEVIVRTRGRFSRKREYPLILILHGAYSNNDNSQHVWTGILRKRSLLLAFLQSSQIMSSDHFVWDDEETALRDIENALSLLDRNYGVSRSKVILGGVSRGAEIALLSLLSSNTRTDGFILVIPSVGTLMERYVKNVHPLTRKDVRGFIITGEKDRRHHKTKLVFKFMRDQGIACELCSVPETGHTIPEDFDLIMERALDFVLNG